jgi:hypothetical protein
LDFNDYLNKSTIKNLTVSQSLKIGNQSVITNQGNSYFVDSGATGASDSNDGKSWANCCATLDGAINKCTANQGDVIYIAEGHSESWTTTGAKAIFDTAGITVIGLGTGSDRPTFSYGHTDATWTISAANITLINLLFITAVDSVVIYGTISGTDCTMINCESRDSTNKEVLDAWTVTTTANRFKVDFYKHIGYIGGDANDSVFQLTGVDDFIIQNCVFMTQSGTTTGSAVIEMVTACLRGLIQNCVFYVDGKSDYSDNIVDTEGTSTVIVKDCYDLEACGKFSGGGNGSSFSLAGDDVGTLSTSLATLQAEFSGATGITAFPAGAAAANSVSVAEVIRYIQENIINGGTVLPATQSLYDILAGTNGIGTFPAAANPANGVSIAEVLRDAWDNIGDAKARTNLQSLVAMLGNPDTAAQSIWDCLAGSGGIATFPAGTAAANDVSLAEVIRYIQENIINDGTVLPATQSLYDILAGANGIAAFPAAAAPANDVSLAEVLRDIWDSLRNGTGGSEPGTNLSIIDELKKGMVHYNNPNYLAVTADLTSATWNTAETHELFTVTGLVRMRIYAEVTTTGDDSSGNTANIQLGVENTTNAFIAATEVDDLTAGEIWYDATPTVVTDDTSSVILDKIVNGEDVGYEITGEAAIDGVIVFHCVWEPLNSTGNVVAGDGSAMV